MLALTFACQPSSAQQGILDYNGKVIVPIKYGQIKKVGEDRYLLFKNKPKPAVYRGMIPSPSIRREKSIPDSAILVDRDGKVLKNPEDKTEAARQAGLIPGPLDKKFRYVQYTDKDHRIVQDSNTMLFGVVDLKSNVLIPVEFNRIRYLCEDMYLASIGDKRSKKRKVYLYHKGSKVKELPNWVRTNGRFYRGAIKLDGKNNAILTRDGEIKYGIDAKIHDPARDIETKAGNFTVVAMTPPRPLPQKFGLKDPAGNLILPFEYSAIKKKENDYLVLYQGEQLRLFDTISKKVIKLPELVRRLQYAPIERGMPIACAFTNEEKTWKTPNELRWGFCDENGKIVIEPKFRNAVSFSDSGGKVRSIVSTDNKMFGIIDATGKWTMKPRNIRLDRFGKDRLLASVPEPDTVLARWNTRPDTRLFSKLLNRYDFINMSAEDLMNILGKPNIPRYPHEKTTDGTSYIRYSMGGGCTGSNLLCFKISADNKVVGWSYYWSELGGKSSPSWIRENVAVIDTEKERSPGNMVPKSELESVRKALGD